MVYFCIPFCGAPLKARERVLRPVVWNLAFCFHAAFRIINSFGSAMIFFSWQASDTSKWNLGLFNLRCHTEECVLPLVISGSEASPDDNKMYHLSMPSFCEAWSSSHSSQFLSVIAVKELKFVFTSKLWSELRSHVWKLWVWWREYAWNRFIICLLLFRGHPKFVPAQKQFGDIQMGPPFLTNSARQSGNCSHREKCSSEKALVNERSAR